MAGKQWHSVSFSGTDDTFIVGTNSGAEVWSARTGRKRYDFDVPGGVGLASVLRNTNLSIVVGTGMAPNFPRCKASVYDHRSRMFLLDFDLGSNIRGIAYTQDRFVIALDTSIRMWDTTSLIASPPLPTCHNPHGAFAVGGADALAYPSEAVGAVTVITRGVSRSWPAHDNTIARMTLDPSAAFLATTTARGETICVWDVAGATEAARFHVDGHEEVDVQCMAFSPDANWLCVVYTNGEAHVFRIPDGTATFVHLKHDVLASCQCIFDPAGTNDGQRVGLIAVNDEKREIVRFSFDGSSGGRCDLDSCVVAQ
ncbi:WD40 domain-containing protein [Acanthamoeba castellanii medusavirus]|uniref:WD40 domain-containing protein n=1 Tax=Acanthamoeba castellanii medusavirus J1 TaxID=3114988 RepID=A0A3T1CXE6_9VIRU|nr:WD40 domain-containing protein [Acanthamoeba castellanii medusavirus]BBI30512.1 WD40 domain-containing protein [Acanthamoeba castellanii medusavirus J1]